MQQKINGKDSAWTLFVIKIFKNKVDEDKGSPLQNGANYLRLYYVGEAGKSRVQRKPFGWCHHPSIFPSIRK